MQYLFIIILMCMSICTASLSATVEGALITQIKGITEKVTIRCSSHPANEQRPNSSGLYSIEVKSLSQDFIIITPKEGDDNLYSPRILPASIVGTDTLYIIPPTNPSLSIIVDNKTNNDFTFVVDKGIIMDEMATSEKDYQLTVIPQHAGTTTLLIAGLTPGFPAVVKSVAINPDQQQGYFIIEPQDIGLEPVSVPPPVRYVETPPVYRPETIIQTPSPQQQQRQPPSTESKIVAPPRPPKEEVKTSGPVRTIPSATSQGAKQDIKRADIAKITAAQSSYYFSDRLIVKDRENSSVALRADYQTSPSTDQPTQIFHYGLELYNIKLMKKYFDLRMQASNSEQLEDAYYRGSLTWHHSPYASIDIAYKSAQNDNWYSEYDIAQTSIGINGYYKSQGIGFQFGAGVRFQIDYGDFKQYFTDLVEKKHRYVQSFYLLGCKNFGTTTTAFMAGFINESFYVSASVLLFKYIGVNYTFKNKSFDNLYFAPLEMELYHRLSVCVNFILKRRDRP